MKSSLNDLLLEILSVIKYRNKEAFVKEFEEMNNVEAMANCIEKLPASQQKEINFKKGDFEAVKKYIPQEVFQEELTKISAEAFGDFISHMKSVLDHNQKQKIAHLITTYSQ